MIIIKILENFLIFMLFWYSSDGFVTSYTGISNIYSKNFSIIEIVIVLLIFIYTIYLYKNNINIRIKNISFKNLSMILIIYIGILISYLRGIDISYSMLLGYPFRFYILSFILGFLMIQIPRKENWTKKTIILIISIILVKDIVGIIQFLFNNGYNFGFLEKVIFPFTDILSNNVLAFSFSFFIIMSKSKLTKFEKIFFLSISIITFTTVILSLKRTSMGIILISIILILFWSKPKKKIILIALIVTGLPFVGLKLASDNNLNDNIILLRLYSLNIFKVKDTDNALLSDNGHMDDTLDAIDNIKQSPITGNGIYTPAIRNRVIWQSNNNFFHNGFLMIWNQTGLIGLYIYIMFFARIIMLVFQNYKYSMSKLVLILILTRIIEQFTLGPLTTQASIITTTNIFIAIYIKYLNMKGEKLNEKHNNLHMVLCRKKRRRE